MRAENKLAKTVVSKEQAEELVKQIWIGIELDEWGSECAVARSGHWEIWRGHFQTAYRELPSCPDPHNHELQWYAFRMLDYYLRKSDEYKIIKKQAEALSERYDLENAREKRQEERDFMALVLGLYPG